MPHLTSPAVAPLRIKDRPDRRHLATFFRQGLRTVFVNSTWWLGNHQELPVRLVSQLPQTGTFMPPFGLLIHLDQFNSNPPNRFTPGILLCALRSALPGSPQRPK